MIDHLGLPVTDLTRAKVFFAQALAPLGYEVLMDFEHQGLRHVGLGSAGKTNFWLSGLQPTHGGAVGLSLHVAFRATSRAQVDAFYQSALTAGGRDNGVPGLRPHYHPNYYGAFVLDHDGHNIEAVCHDPI